MKILVALVFAGAAVGCSERRDETEKSEAAEAREDVAFLVIDGWPLTVARVREAVMVRAKMAELAGNPISEAEFATWANGQAMRLVGPLANQRLMDAECVRRGVVAEPIDIGAVLTNFVQITGVKATTRDELAKAFGDLQEPFLRQFDESARLAAYTRKYWTITASDNLAKQHMAMRTNAWLKAQEIDATARANSEKAYARLKAGEAWAKVAAECSEDKLINPGNERFAKEWCWMGVEARGLRELAAALPKMKVGEYTQPLETNDGLLIVKVLEKKGVLFRVARIMFRMALPVSVPADLEKARAEVSAKIKANRQAVTLRELEQKAHFEYPMGTNFTYKIWKEGNR